MRITKKQVWEVLERTKNRGVDIDVDSNAAGIAFTNRAGNTMLTRRFTTREAYHYMCGVSAGVDFGINLAHNHAS